MKLDFMISELPDDFLVARFRADKSDPVPLANEALEVDHLLNSKTEKSAEMRERLAARLDDLAKVP